MSACSRICRAATCRTWRLSFRTSATTSTRVPRARWGPGCSDDQNSIAQGDAALNVLIPAIKNSPAWKHGNNVIVLVWDENDYSSLPNQVVTTIETNYAANGKISNVKYNHFSLLKTLEAGFGLRYINHAADRNVKLMSDLFAK